MPDAPPAEAPPIRPEIGPGLATPDALRNAIRWLARAHGWPGDGQGEFAALAGITRPPLRRWLTGERPISGEALALLVGLLLIPRLIAALRDDYRPGPWPVSESMDRLFFSLRREPRLAKLLRPEDTDTKS